MCNSEAKVYIPNSRESINILELSMKSSVENKDKEARNLSKGSDGALWFNKHILKHVWDTGICRLYREVEENPVHILCWCPALVHEEPTIRKAYSMPSRRSSILLLRRCRFFLRQLNMVGRYRQRQAQ